MPLIDRLAGLVAARADGRGLALVRIVLGGTLILRAFEGWRIMSGVISVGSLRMPCFNWVPDLPPEALPLFIGVWGSLALLFLIGFYTRLIGSLLVGLLTYVLLLDQQLYTNHLYLLILLVGLLTLGDCGARFSIDAILRKEIREVPRWVLTLLKMQLSIVYGFSALAKINLVYLSGVVLSFNCRKSVFGRLTLPWHGAGVLSMLALVTIVGEIALALGMWSVRWRTRTIGLGVVFHLAIVGLMNPELRMQLVVFSFEMFSLYLLFIDSEPGTYHVVWKQSLLRLDLCMKVFRKLDWLGLCTFTGLNDTKRQTADDPVVLRAGEPLRVITPTGPASGYQAWVLILRHLPMSFLWAPFLQLPVIRSIGRRLYVALAR